MEQLDSRWTDFHEISLDSRWTDFHEISCDSRWADFHEISYDSRWTDFHEISYLVIFRKSVERISGFVKISQEFRVLYIKSISRSVLLKMRIVSHRSCTETM